MVKKISLKTQKSAEADYINNLSISKIAKKNGVSHSTVKRWSEKFEWKKKREQAITESARKDPTLHNKIIEDQIQITNKANSIIMDFLLRIENNEPVDNKLFQTVTMIMKHGLEVVRPKSIAQYNFMKQENNNIGITSEQYRRLMEVMDDR